MVAKNTTKVEPKVVTKQQQEYLKCILTDEEVAQAANELAREISTVSELDKAFDSIKAEFKGKIEKSEANISVKARLVRDKHEYRNIECDAIHNFTDCTVTIVRKDTGEQVETRKMTYAEKQTTMEFDAKDTKKEPALVG